LEVVAGSHLSIRTVGDVAEKTHNRNKKSKVSEKHSLEEGSHSVNQKKTKETLENPSHPRENSRVSACAD